MTWDLLSTHQNDFIAQFNYLCYSKLLECPTAIRIQDGLVVAEENATSIQHNPDQGSSAQTLPQLCTQSGKGNSPSNSGPTDSNQVAVVSGNNSNTYIGYRNQKSFRFLRVRYAPKPSRFAHSQPDNSTHQVSNNTMVGPDCVQDGDSSQTSEDCLFLNIQTPYLPKADLSTEKLKPVLFYIHGGALISGSSNDWTTDGSNLASREDVVVVNINYRLGTYGFFAVPDTHYMGNYAIGDVVNALEWTHANIAYFGGDATRISIVGQSAGAALVRVLMGSPKAVGLFHNAIAMSNLGGAAADLGQSEDWGTPNTFYYTSQKSFDSAGASILTSAGCDGSDDGDLADQVDKCLVAYNGLAQLTTQARWIVQDGSYVTGPYLEVGRSGSVARVPFLTGIVADDGASFTSNEACANEVDCLVRDLSIGQDAAQSVIDSKLFPYYNQSGNATHDGFNVSQRVRTDDTFRCVDQATAYAVATTNSTGQPVFYYQNNHGLGGYNPAGVPDGSSSSFSSSPYYRLHSADTQFVFGNVAGEDLRPPPADDLVAMRLLSSYWAAFVRSGDPNPDRELLRARGYMDTYRTVTDAGTWTPVVGRDGPLMLLDTRPAMQNAFVDVPQCDFLNYSLDYFVVHPNGV